MSYQIITAELITRTALHIGSGEGNELTDALLRRDSQGRLLLPGSALAGQLRSIVTRLASRLGYEVCQALYTPAENKKFKTTACKCLICDLFGNVNPQARADQGRASRVWVADAYLIDIRSTIDEATQRPSSEAATNLQPKTYIRDGVGIDRRSRTAASQAQAKFDLEVLPPGAVFTLCLELEDCSDIGRQLLAVALAEWQEGRGTIGGRTNRGLGAFELNNLQYATRSLTEIDDVVDFLKTDTPRQDKWLMVEPNWLNNQVQAAQKQLKTWGETKPIVEEKLGSIAESIVARSWLEITFTLEAKGPFLINDPLMQAQTGFDHAPLGNSLLEPANGAKGAKQKQQFRPVLPGASLRGALRSHAERLARTLVTREIWKNSDNPENDFLIHCPACDPNARRKRGIGKDEDIGTVNDGPKMEEQGVPLESCDSLLRAKGVKDDQEIAPAQLCLICRLFGSTRLGSRLRIEDAHFVGEKPIYKALDFLAIDRFTGGGAEHFKFDAIALWQPTFKARLRLENPQAWELGWLLLTLRDLQDGFIPLGFGAAKGMGQVKVADWAIRLGFLKSDDVPGGLPTGVTPNNESGLYQVIIEKWAAANPPLAWQNQVEGWLAAFKETWQAFKRDDLDDGKLPKMGLDTYFGQGQLTELYPAEVRLEEKN